ncbi:MAG: RNA polymerase sigma factor [Spirochaetia bacterium]|nr:RNA polymerase sigma factor [Spirochaetia bacterium]
MDLEREKEVIEASRTDPKAFGEIFEAYYPKLFRYVAYRTGNADAAKDITAEAFYKSLNKLHTFKWAGVPFYAWLVRIASNEVNYYYRKKKYEPLLFEDALNATGTAGPAVSPDTLMEIAAVQENMDNNDDFKDVLAALKKLPAVYREVIILKFLEEYKITEICAILGKKEGTVKSLLSRGTEMLKGAFNSR